jgi:SAM-dependent methyltransferase
MRIRRRLPVRWGSLGRTRPLSTYYGYDRGKPVDRAYIERFLEANARDIRGRVLEVRDPRYTVAYGGDRVTSSDVLDIDSTNQDATVVADLGSPASLPEGRFDCVIVTQTLQYVHRPESAIENLYRTLSADGVALITVPCATRLDTKLAAVDRWRFTPAGLELLLREGGEWSELDVRGFGNVLTSAAFLFGVAADELRERELAEHDEAFPLIAAARARKPAERSE